MSSCVIRNYSEILTRTMSDMYEVKIDRVKDKVFEFLNEILKADSRKHNENTYVFNTEKYDGEYTILNDEMIHIYIVRKEKSTTITTSETINVPITWGTPNWTQPNIQVWRDEPFCGNYYSPSYTVPPHNIPNVPPTQNEKIINYMVTKRGNEVMSYLDNAKTASFGDITDATDMSTSTVSKSLKEAEELKLVEKIYNGKTKYKLTEFGRKLNPKKFKATTG